MNQQPPLTEAALQAYVDEQLSVERRREIESYLATRPDEAERLASYRAHKRELRALFDPVLDEPVPARVLRAARPPRAHWALQRLTAGIAIAVVSGALGWGLRGAMPQGSDSGTLAQQQARQPQSADVLLAAASGFAQRAAVAHAVYAPDARRAVEVDAEHEDQLVAWLSKRMGARMQAPRLHALGYELVGGRLLPGESKPVAQFMYQDGSGSKLTLYASNELPGAGVPTATPNADTAFSFAQRGALNTFYWVDGEFGYALSAGADRAELTRVSAEVYRQLASGARQ